MKNNHDGNHGYNDISALSTLKMNYKEDDNNNDNNSNNLFNHIII